MKTHIHVAHPIWIAIVIIRPKTGVVVRRALNDNEIRYRPVPRFAGVYLHNIIQPARCRVRTESRPPRVQDHRGRSRVDVLKVLELGDNEGRIPLVCI